jgi:hypothetical protein
MSSQIRPFLFRNVRRALSVLVDFEVKNAQERYAIPEEQRTEGLLCRQLNTDEFFILEEGIENIHWVPFDIRKLYLNSFIETDPVFMESPAASIEDTDISNWDQAFSWGNHASEGYLTELPNHDLVAAHHTVSGLTEGHFLKALSATTYGFAAHGLTASDVGALPTALDSSRILIGNSSNVATDRTLTLNETPGTFALGSTGGLTMPNASGTVRGLLSAANWTTFNNKQAALSSSTSVILSSNTLQRAALSGDVSASQNSNAVSVTGIRSKSITLATGYLRYTGSAWEFKNETYLTSVTAHNLLSSTHGDTLAASVVRGDILIGNSTPKWARLAKGTNGQVLSTDGTDVFWGASPSYGHWTLFGGAIDDIYGVNIESTNQVIFANAGLIYATRGSGGNAKTITIGLKDQAVSTLVGRHSDSPGAPGVITLDPNTLSMSSGGVLSAIGGGGFDGLTIDNKGTSTTLQFDTNDDKLYIVSASGSRNIYINNATATKSKTLVVHLSSSNTTDNRTINWYYGTSGSTAIPDSCWQDGVKLSTAVAGFTYLVTITNIGTGSSNLRISFVRMPK